jgi:chemotaxis protein CheD
MSGDVFLHPGDYHFAEGPARIQTILGSCIAFTMRDPLSGRAAMCHCLLPQMPAEEARDRANMDIFRYVDTTFDAMLQEFQRYGVPSGRLEIKLFGGANVLTRMSKNLAIGSLNQQQAKHSLQKFSLRLRAHDVGGEAGRRLVFETATGEVFVKTLRVMTTLPESLRKRGRAGCLESVAY